ncbi:MAG: hypothetical protein OEN01_02590 [Candidatus Krumholzibacteria bacterium]|nr:hypothetical protein [Candidatus Krumholzibacteria bacterium]
MNRQFTTAFTLCLILAVGLVVCSCNRQQIAPNGAGFLGVYALISVNGELVPTSISHEGVTLQVRSGTLTINADGTCSGKTVFVPPSGAEVVREVTATYTKDGSKLTMQWEGAGKTVGTIQGNTFIMDNEGMAFVYRK